MRIGWLVVAALMIAACGAEGDTADPPENEARARCFPTVRFGDPRLDEQVRHRLGLPNVPLTVLEIEAVWWWNGTGDTNQPDIWDIDGADFYGIRDLEGIQCLPLKHVSCADCPIPSLEPLSGMPQLESIAISGAQAPSLDPLAGLVWLREVALTDGALVDASALLGGGAELPKLRSLNLARNQIVAPEGRATLGELATLVLADNALSAPPDLSAMPSLTELNLEGNPLETIEPLAAASALVSLTIRDAGLTSLAPIAALELRTLAAEGNALTTAADVPAEVTRLWLDGNPLGTMAGLRARSLHRLSARGCGLTSTEGLGDAGRFGNESEIDLSDNHIDDLSGLIGWDAELASLDLSENPLRDLTTLPPAGLRALRITGGALESLDGIENVTAIADLEIDVSANPLVDISAIAGLVVDRQLTVNLDDTQVHDITPLAVFGAARHLLTISANRTAFSELDQLGAFADGREVSISLDGNGLTDASALAIPGELAWLSLRDNGFTAAPMPRIMAIRGGIDLSGNALTAIPTFTGVALQGLGALILADNAIADITPLEALGSTLPYVDLSGNAIVHIPKVDAPWMNALDLSENPIATIEAGLRADEIICRRCGLEDLNVLAPFFARVAVLDLSENPIASLAPLSAASGLRSLTIDGIAGLDYAANPWLGHLSELVARDSGIVDLAPLVGVERLDLRGNAIADLSPLAGRPGEVYDLRENPVDLDIDLLALYDLCIHDQVTIHWDAGTCVKPADYGES